MNTTNYYNTFIQVAEDCPASAAEVPPKKGDALSVANMQFDMIYDHPYRYTSDDVLFHVFAIRNGISKANLEEEKEQFFSKGQACFRASPLTKRYGWGVHFDAQGKMALVAVELSEYEKLTKDKNLKQLKAMRSKRA